MEKNELCTHAAGKLSCPLVGFGRCEVCGWYAPEAARRRALPLVEDEETGLRRKHVGRGEEARP